jgi:hypothetical protein
MTMKRLAVAVALLLSATTIALAQAQPNCAPGAPVRGDCYGQPYSGTVEGRCVCPHFGHYRHHHHWG